MRRPRLAEQVAVVLQRRRLRAAFALQVPQPRGRDLPERDAALTVFPLDAVDLPRVGVVLGDERGHAHGGAFLVEEAFRHSPAAYAPATGGIALEPRRPQATLHLTAAVSPLRLEHGAARTLHNDQRSARLEVLRIAH